VGGNAAGTESAELDTGPLSSWAKRNRSLATDSAQSKDPYPRPRLSSERDSYQGMASGVVFRWHHHDKGCPIPSAFFALGMGGNAVGTDSKNSTPIPCHLERSGSVVRDRFRAVERSLPRPRLSNKRDSYQGMASAMPTRPETPTTPRTGETHKILSIGRNYTNEVMLLQA